jgi:hypothetical protein
VKKYLILFLLTFISIITIASEEKKVFYCHYGVYDDIGFFSNYSGINIGIDYKVKAFKVGVNQKITYGFHYEEVIGITDLRIYIHDQVFVNIGASYLIKESRQDIVKDFNTTILPLIGFGFCIPIKNTTIQIVPMLQMNQSYYLTDEIRHQYSELPFIIGMTLGIGIDFKL